MEMDSHMLGTDGDRDNVCRDRFKCGSMGMGTVFAVMDGDGGKC